MKKGMKRKCIWTGMVLAITFMTGCSQIRNGWPPPDSSEPDQSTSLSDQGIDPRTEDTQQPTDAWEQGQSTSVTDQQIDPQKATGQQPPDAGEQGQTTPKNNQQLDPDSATGRPPNETGERGETTPMADQQIDAQTDAGQQPSDAGEQGKAMPMADQQADPQNDAGQQPSNAGEQGQATPMADQQADSQNDAGQQPSNAGEQNQPTPTADQQIASQTMTSNPMWVTGPSPYELQPNERSYLIAGLNLGESAEVIPASTPNLFQAYSITRLYGILDLVKKIRRFNTSINYKGGAYFYGESGTPWSARSVQQLTFSETISWPRTKLNLQDSPSYFPGASFGSYAFGGAGSYTLGLGGSSTTNDYFGFNDFSGIGGVEHFTNVALAQVTHSLTERSSIMVAGADAITDYFGGGSINSQQISALVGYTYAASARTNLSASYGYQALRFLGGETADASMVQVNYGRSLSPRVTFSLSGGPQFITSYNPYAIAIGPVYIGVTSHQTGFIAEASLGYGLRNGNLGLNYEHLLTSGSGLFAGATSDILSASMTRRIWRAWATNFSAGFARLSNNITNQSSGILGNSYQYWFAGFGVQHRLGRHLNFLASYQFDDNGATSACSPSSGCASNVHTALISITWRALPISLDRGNVRDWDNESPPINVQNPEAALP